MSDEDIEKMIRGIYIQNFQNRDKQEVKGYYELLLNVFSSWKTIKFSESTITIAFVINTDYNCNQKGLQYGYL